MDADDDLVVAFVERIGDVERERVIGTAMPACQSPVDPDIGLPVNRAEVQLNPASLPFRRNSHRAPIPHVPYMPFAASNS